MRVLTWNIRWGCGCDNRVDFDRIVGVIHGFDTPEVLCLQEVAVNHPGLTGSQGENQVNELSSRLPGYSAHYGIGSDLPDEMGGRRLFGNLVLSRLPVLQVFRHTLPYPADPNHPSMVRVAVEAVVQAEFGPLRIVTTHLEYYSLAQRRAQMDGLRRIHAEAAGHAAHARPDRDTDSAFKCQPRPLTSIYCGDFNCAPEAPERAELLAPFDNDTLSLRDAWEIVHPGRPHAHTVGLHACDWPDHPYCCDYFLVTEDLEDRILDVLVNQDTDASDHQPVCLRLA